jgi:hypothetical protein
MYLPLPKFQIQTLHYIQIHTILTHTCMHIYIVCGLSDVISTWRASLPALKEHSKVHSKLQQNAFDVFGTQTHVCKTMYDHIYR